MKIISVVRNFTTYKRSTYSQSTTDLVPIDNTSLNLGVAERYNQFLNNFNYSNSQWLVFCHEDWQINQSWDFLESLRKDRIYGPIGIVFDKFSGTKKLYGQIKQYYNINGTFRSNGKKITKPHIVSTLDCQCIIVYSDLIRDTGLRFDETFTFDLYVEEFCINAKEHFGINSYAVPIKCTHFSEGRVGERYYKLAECLKIKYNNVKNTYYGTVPVVSPLIGKYPIIFYVRRFIKGIFSFRVSFVKKLYSFGIVGICLENYDSKRPCLFRINLKK